jgi:hypothetical protein
MRAFIDTTALDSTDYIEEILPKIWEALPHEQQ